MFLTIIINTLTMTCANSLHNITYMSQSSSHHIMSQSTSRQCMLAYTLYNIHLQSSYIANRWLKHCANGRHIMTKPTKNSALSGRCKCQNKIKTKIEVSSSLKVYNAMFKLFSKIAVWLCYITGGNYLIVFAFSAFLLLE